MLQSERKGQPDSLKNIYYSEKNETHILQSFNGIISKRKECIIFQMDKWNWGDKESVNIHQYYGTLYNNKVRAIKLEDSY